MEDSQGMGMYPRAIVLVVGLDRIVLGLGESRIRVSEGTCFTVWISSQSTEVSVRKNQGREIDMKGRVVHFGILRP